MQKMTAFLALSCLCLTFVIGCHALSMGEQQNGWNPSDPNAYPSGGSNYPGGSTGISGGGGSWASSYPTPSAANNATVRNNSGAGVIRGAQIRLNDAGTMIIVEAPRSVFADIAYEDHAGLKVVGNWSNWRPNAQAYPVRLQGNLLIATLPVSLRGQQFLITHAGAQYSNGHEPRHWYLAGRKSQRGGDNDQLVVGARP